MPSNRINPVSRTLQLVVLSSVILACQTVPQTVGPQEQGADSAAATQAQQPDPLQTLQNQANEAMREGLTDLAIQQYSELVQQDPSASKAYTNLGLLYLHKKDNKAAQQAFINAIEQDKTDAIAYNHLAIIQRQEGLFKQALFNYYKAINADPDYANAHLNLGILFDLYLQEFPKALEQYEKYQQLTGNSNKEVEKWIIDIKRRIDDKKGK